MNKVLRIVLIILLFIGFFEIGLFSSYTIVTSEVPDVQGLIDLQVDTISNFINPQSISNVIIKNPSNINITNRVDTAMAMADMADIDGVSVPNMTATTQQSTEDGHINVTITTVGYSAPNSTYNSTHISTIPTYRVTAVAEANITGSLVIIDVNTIKITSILKLYGNETSAPTTTINTTNTSN